MNRINIDYATVKKYADDFVGIARRCERIGAKEAAEYWRLSAAYPALLHEVETALEGTDWTPGRWVYRRAFRLLMLRDYSEARSTLLAEVRKKYENYRTQTRPSHQRA